MTETRVHAPAPRPASDRQPPDVALFPSAYAPHLGGVEELTRKLADTQRARGGRPMVVTMRWPKTLPARETIDDVPVHRRVFHVPELRWRHLAGYAVHHRATTASLTSLVRRHGARVVHVQCVAGNGLYARRVARELRLPLVVTLQGELTMDAAQVYQRSRFLPAQLRTLLREADAVTACSAHTLAEAVAFTGVHLGPRGHVIHNGVALDEFDAAAPERRARPYLLAIGRHVPQKGFDVLLRALALLDRDARRGHEVVLAGDGPERGTLERMAAALDLADTVTFVGRCDRARTAALFRGCTGFVLPSRHEPQGIVNLEAMAAGRPVVATKVGGVPEIVGDGTTGFLVRPADPRALAAAIVELLADGERAAAMGRAGRAVAERFDWSQVADRYDAVYREVIERRGTPS